VEQNSSTISRRSSRWSPSQPTHATTSDESWCQISRREVIKLAIHATLQLPPNRAPTFRPRSDLPTKDVALRHSAISVGYTRIRVGDSNFQFRQQSYAANVICLRPTRAIRYSPGGSRTSERSRRQFSIWRFGTRENSRVFAVTTIRPRASAVPAIITS